MSDYDAIFADVTQGKPSASPYDDVMQQVIAAQATPSKAQEPVVQAGEAINQATSHMLPTLRDAGLAVRYGIEGPAQAAQIVTEPLRHYVTDPIRRQFGFLSNGPDLTSLVTGKTEKPTRSATTGELGTALADFFGLPKPETPTERVVGEGTRLVAGAGGMAKASQMAANAIGPVSEYVASSASPALQWWQNFTNASKAVPAGLGSNVPAQLTSAAGAGLFGGASREAGGTGTQQALAALTGGIFGGLTPGSVNAITANTRRLLTSPQQLDAKISVVLERSGVDFAALPEKARQTMRAQMADALAANQELDPAAVRRLADFALTGTTPTRGMVSQNPVQITREQNLAKTAANSSDTTLHGLPMVQNQNNTKLIANLNEAGAAKGDPYQAGQSAVSGIQGRDKFMGDAVSGMYGRARNMAGGDIPLDRKPFVDNVFDSLTKENRMAFLPKEIGDTLNQISGGKAPFTPQTVDMLKTMIATAQRGTSDGNVKAALSIARKAIDDTPMNITQFGGTAPVNPATLNAAGQTANDFMGALNRARTAASRRFNWQESARPIEAAVEGAQPDKFVQQYVINGTVNDAQELAKNIPTEAREQVKNAILSHLKDKALNGASDEVGKFSQSAFNKALNGIGDRKLALFFSPEEVKALKANGRVASYMQVQPVGSAVNNSNSGALMIGKLYDALKGGLGVVPGVGPVASGVLDLTLGNPTRNAYNWLGQRQAMNAGQGLLAPQLPPPMGSGLLLPGMAYSGLLAGGAP